MYIALWKVYMYMYILNRCFDINRITMRDISTLITITHEVAESGGMYSVTQFRWNVMYFRQTRCWCNRQQIGDIWARALPLIVFPYTCRLGDGLRYVFLLLTLCLCLSLFLTVCLSASLCLSVFLSLSVSLSISFALSLIGYVRNTK